jgi:choice-of-anchor A domain-containing protein
MFRPTLAWLAALPLALGFATPTHAGYVTNTLATAGPNSFGVLSLATTSNVVVNESSVTGAVGVSGTGFLQLANPPTAVQGNVYLGNGASIQNASQVSGSIFTNQNTKLSKAGTDALNASKTFAALAPTLSVPGGVIFGSTTLTGVAGINVLNVSNIFLWSGQTLTLAGPAGAQWVINDSGGLLLLGGGKIVEAGGSSPYDVALNITGGDLTFTLSLLNNDTVINGLILAPKSSVFFNGGVVNGELIAGGSGTLLNDGASVNEAQDPSTPVTPAPSALVLMSLGAVGFLGLMVRSGYGRSVPA